MVSPKTIAVALCNAALLAKADFQQMADQVVALLEQSNSTQTLRGAAFSPFFRNRIQELVNSGCWCYFDDDHHKAHGTTVNQVDEHCRDLHHGYSCAQIDAGPDCIPWAHTYVASSGLTTHEPQIYEECLFNNGGAPGCAAYSCAVETLFVFRIYEFLKDNTFDPAFQHDNFDTTTCGIPPTTPSPGRGPNGGGHEHTGPGTPKTIYECCAEYPLRFPFDATNTRECCEASGVTYDSATMFCCSDGSIRVSC